MIWLQLISHVQERILLSQHDQGWAGPSDCAAYMTASCIGGFSSGVADPLQLLPLTLSPLPGSLSVSKEVFSHHILRRHHLDCSILLLNGLVGTPGKTLTVTPSAWFSFCLPSGFAF